MEDNIYYMSSKLWQVADAIAYEDSCLSNIKRTVIGHQALFASTILIK